MKVPLGIFILVLGLVGCTASKAGTTSSPVSHKLWNNLLSKYVSSSGLVDYKGFKADSVKLNEYLEVLSSNPPDNEKWSKDERLAYWINAYNAFTVQLIVRNYPCNSIKDLGGKVYKINTPWDIKFIEIGGKKYDLNNIEHAMIRREFDESRIHFALNCASISCPPLRNEAYTAEKLDAQLTSQTATFIANKEQNNLSSEKAQLSKIFSWYKGDFEKTGTWIDFVNRYSETKISEKTEIIFVDYNWGLNEQ